MSANYARDLMASKPHHYVSGETDTSCPTVSRIQSLSEIVSDQPRQCICVHADQQYAQDDHRDDHPSHCLMCTAPTSELVSLRRSDVSLSSFRTSKSIDVTSTPTPRRCSSSTTMSTSSPLPPFSTSTMSVSRDSHSSNDEDRSLTNTVTSTVSIPTAPSSPPTNHSSSSPLLPLSPSTPQPTTVVLPPSVPLVVQSTLSKNPPSPSPRVTSCLAPPTSQSNPSTSPTHSRNPPLPQRQQRVKSHMSSSPSSPQPCLYNHSRPRSLGYDNHHPSRKIGAAGFGLGVRPRSQGDTSSSSSSQQGPFSSPFLEPLSTGRLPKARVFVHRDRRKPLHGVASSADGSPSASDKRCVSDLAAVAERSNCAPPPFSQGRLYTDLTDAAAYLSADLDVIPPWIPRDELRDWAPASSPSSRATGSAKKASPGAAAAVASLNYASARRKGKRHQTEGIIDVDSGSTTDFDDDDDDDYVDDNSDMVDVDLEADSSKITTLTTLMSSTSASGNVPSGGIPNGCPGQSVDPSGAGPLLNDGRWAASLRSLAALARPKGKEPPCIRGSILDVSPPSLSERFGLGALGAGKKVRSAHSDARPVSQGRRGRVRTDLRDGNEAGCSNAVVKSSTGRELLAVSIDADVFTRPSRRAMEREPLATGHVPVVHGKDEYVGFLIDSAKAPGRRRQRRWLRIFRWSRSPPVA